MTPQSPKAVTALDRCHLILWNLKGWTARSEDFDLCGAITEQIKLAQKEAVRDAVMNLSNNEGAEIAYAKGFSDGQVAMREETEKIAKEHEDCTDRGCFSGAVTCGARIAALIHILHPHAPGEGNTK